MVDKNHRAQLKKKQKQRKKKTRRAGVQSTNPVLSSHHRTSWMLNKTLKGADCWFVLEEPSCSSHDREEFSKNGRRVDLTTLVKQEAFTDS